MDDEQLLQFDEQQARQQLNDEQLERYNELKQGELKDAIEEKEEKDNEARTKGLQAVRESKESELTTQVQGLNFLADINDKQVSKLRRLSQYEDKKEENLNDQEVANIKDDLISLLSELNKDYTEDEWRDEFGDAGLFTIASLAYDVVDAIEEVTEEKKSSLNNGRRKTAQT